MKFLGLNGLKRQGAFTLIEIMLVLGIATLMSIAAIQATKREGEQQVANASATQMNELSSALTKQISRNYSAYAASPRTTITISDLQTSGLLPNFYLNQTPFGGVIEMEAVSTGGATPSVTGLITTTPWTSPSGNPRYDLLGATIRKIGAQGGVSYYSSTVVAGLNGGWSAVKGVNPSEFTYISAPGQLAMRIYVDSVGEDGVYLRRDGTLPMIGNLDVGFHDINNAVNISANGWIYANHIAANDATLGSVFSNYIRNTGGIDTAQITGIGSSSVANFEFLTARTQVAAGKLLLTDTVTIGTACTPNGLVSKDTTGNMLVCQAGVYSRYVKTSGDMMTGRLGVSTNDWGVTLYDGAGGANAAKYSAIGSAYVNDIYIRAEGRWGSQLFGGHFATNIYVGCYIGNPRASGACGCPAGFGAYPTGQYSVYTGSDSNGYICQ